MIKLMEQNLITLIIEKNNQANLFNLINPSKGKINVYFLF